MKIRDILNQDYERFNENLKFDSVYQMYYNDIIKQLRAKFSKGDRSSIKIEDIDYDMAQKLKYNLEKEGLYVMYRFGGKDMTGNENPSKLIVGI